MHEAHELEAIDQALARVVRRVPATLLSRVPFGPRGNAVA
jgi:hypothetical protein